jgi:FixJ family two-component response regulator
MTNAGFGKATRREFGPVWSLGVGWRTSGLRFSEPRQDRGPPLQARPTEGAPPPLRLADPGSAVEGKVFVVDADASAREAVEALIRRAGARAVGYASAETLVAASAEAGPCCLVLELAPPELSGLDVQRRIARERPDMPVIFISDGLDLRDAVEAMKRGAIELLSKPVDGDALLAAVRRGLDTSRAVLADAAEMQALHARYGSLTPREREVMGLVVRGLMNKQVAGELGVSEVMVKVHRAKIMRKMEVRTLAGLVLMSVRLQEKPSRA